MKYTVQSGERTLEVELVERLGKLLVTVDGELLDLHYEEADQLGQVLLMHDGRSHAISIEGDGHRVDVTLAGHHYSLTLEDEREHAAHGRAKRCGQRPAERARDVALGGDGE